MKTRSFLLTLILLLGGAVQAASAQTTDESTAVECPEAVLIEEFGNRSTSEERSARVDRLMTMLMNLPDSTGVMVFYCGQTCHYGEFEAHLRGFSAKLKLKMFPADRISVLFGGYRKEGATQFWVVPPGAGLPVPRSELSVEEVNFKGKYKKAEMYECC